jgi:threonine dehydratase
MRDHHFCQGGECFLMSSGIPTRIFSGHDGVRQAHGIIVAHIRETPIERAYSLEQGDGQVWLKLESHQVTGSFKARGAMYRVLSLADAEKVKGIVTCSAGNHGLGVAFAAEQAGVHARIFVPKGVDQDRLARLSHFSADVEVFDGGYDECERHAIAAAEREGRVFVSPYNDPWVIAGQGTIGIELLSQVPKIEVALVAVGGGGLIGGVAAYLKAANPAIKVVGVSPANSAAMYDIVTGIPSDFSAHLETLSDSTAGGVQEGAITIDLCRALVDEWILPEEADIKAAMRYLFYEHRLVVEGAGALTVAAYLREVDRLKDMNCALIVCGGNIEPNKLWRLGRVSIVGGKESRA